MLPELPISQDTLLLLVITSFIASAWTAAIGVGGGTLVLAVLVIVVPVTAVVPLHSMVQLGSNSGRAIMTYRHISTPIFNRLLLGTTAGTLLALPLSAFWLSEHQLTLLLAFVTLAVTWLPLPVIQQRKPRNDIIFGAGLSFLGVFVSATGPLVAAYLRHQTNNRHELAGTMAASVGTMNLFRIVLFTGLGFTWTEWVLPLMLMIGAGFIGTRLGLLLLGRIPEATFQLILKGVLTLLAIMMIAR